MSELNLEHLDVDGAIRESAHNAGEALEAEGDTRATFFKKAGLAGGAVISGGSLLSILAPTLAVAGDRPPASVFGKGDIGILNFALTLEYLEAAFYNEASRNQANKTFIKDAQTKVFLAQTTSDENTHVATLKSVLKGKAVKSPKFNFRGTTSDEKMFQATSFALENEGVHAYSGQALNISSGAVVKAAVSIVTVEARHASVIGLILKGTGKGISPNGSFDVPFGAKRVLSDVKKTRFIK